jgi:hypothetical protein
MPPGGKRQGAGAPKRNMNALKHGRYSRQMAQLGAAIFADPRLRAAALQYTDRAGIKARQDQKRLALLFAHWLADFDRRARNASAHRTREQAREDALARSLANVRLNLDAPALDAATISPAERESLLAQIQEMDQILETQFPGTINNQKPHTNPKNQSAARHETPLIEPPLPPD